MSLHTVNFAEESPNCKIMFEQLTPGDEVIFLEKGLYLCAKNSKFAAVIYNLHQNNGVNFYLLENTKLDSISSPAREMLTCVDEISYSDFVALTVKHEKTISWF